MLMQPNAPTPVPTTSPDYDFILNNNASPTKKSFLPGMNGTNKQRILVLAAAAGIFLLLVVLVYSLLFGGSKNKPLLEVAQFQQELIRISNEGASKAQSAQTRSLALTTQFTLTTSQRDVVAQLKKLHQKTNNKILGVKKSAQTDALLKQAATNNRYDEALTQILTQQLVEYQRLLKTANSSTSNQKIQSMLNSEFSQAATLIASTQNK